MWKSLCQTVAWATPRLRVASNLKAIRMTKHAIIIGNSAYKDSAMVNLRCAANDAHSMAALLQRHMGYQTVVRLDATVVDMLYCIENMAQATKPGDSVLIYYAGHGLSVAQHHHWLGVEVQADLLQSQDLAGTPGLLSMQALSMLTARFEQCHRLVIQDACRGRSLGQESRGISREIDGQGKLSIRAAVLRSTISPGPTATPNPYGLTFLSSCHSTGCSIDLSHHGLFTLCLMEHLEAACSAGRKVVVDDHLAADLAMRMRDHAGGVELTAADLPEVRSAASVPFELVDAIARLQR